MRNSLPFDSDRLAHRTHSALHPPAALARGLEARCSDCARHVMAEVAPGAANVSCNCIR